MYRYLRTKSEVRIGKSVSCIKDGRVLCLEPVSLLVFEDRLGYVHDQVVVMEEGSRCAGG